MRIDPPTGTSAVNAYLEPVQELIRRGIPVIDMDTRLADDLLGLIFMACHPILSPDARSALTLTVVCGLSTEDVARAFLTPAAIPTEWKSPPDAGTEKNEGRISAADSAVGFYEAVDYTPSRLRRGETRAVVRSFMAHHQGMSLLSLAYLLLDRNAAEGASHGFTAKG